MADRNRLSQSRKNILFYDFETNATFRKEDSALSLHRKFNNIICNKKY